MKKFVELCATLSVLAACTPVDVNTPPISVVPNNPSASVGIDVYGRSRARGNPVPKFRGQNTLTIRATGKKSDGGIGEIVGVTCSLDSGLYKANLRTPANVIVPGYGPNSPAIFIQCAHPDGRKGSRTINAFNLSAKQRGAAAYGTGVVGAIIIGAVNAAKTDPTKDEFAYPPTTIRLR